MTLEQDLADLHALNARFIHNCITRNVASHDAITHPQFVCLSTNGKYTKASVARTSVTTSRSSARREAYPNTVVWIQ
jgi:hypothetical protein